MKAQRQAALLEIIATGKAQTQDDILQQLLDMGYNCTQATVSRDMKDLRIGKQITPDGSYRYVTSMNESEDVLTIKLLKIFREGVVSCEAAQNIVVIKTLTGLASTVCFTLDRMELEEVVGTIAGDDTVIVIMRDNASAQEFLSKIDAI